MEIDGQLFRMINKDGFVSVFWEVVREYSASGIRYSHEMVFEELNRRYADTFGEPRFKSFDAFRHYRDKRYRNKP